MNNRGISILSIILAIAMMSGMFLLVGSVYSQNEAVLQANREKLMAEQYASELAEYFRSFTMDNLRDKIDRDPMDPTNPAGVPYPRCSHVNLLDRTSGSVLNPDPVANLPPTLLDDANRFYMVTVVNATTLSPVPAACGSTPYVYAPTDRFLVTVGVSYKGRANKTGNAIVHRVVLSTLIP